ncbi:MAG: hypothetical protein IVW55_09450 [Chloroflexi bacterium]|nr:hypothetical protein [Chloroflexota bacterium]
MAGAGRQGLEAYKVIMIMDVARLRLRFPLMVLALATLLIAMWAGLVRLGWGMPPLLSELPEAHGGLMVCGFLGTLIGLERAVAVRQRWAYGAPLLTALGGIGLMAGLQVGRLPLGPLLLVVGSFWLVAVYVAVLRVQSAMFTVTMALGAVSLLAGNALWLAGFDVYRIVLFWAGFLILTIAGERLELSRMLRLPAWSRSLFTLVVAALGAALLLSTFMLYWGARLFGVGLIGLALWLLRNDIARRTIHQRGLTRFMAMSLLLGYAWLIVGGLVAIVFGLVDDTPYYDALLHSIFLGFVFSMIFAHAPVILPAVTGLAVPYRRAFYGHLALLHASLALRIGSDLIGWGEGRL